MYVTKKIARYFGLQLTNLLQGLHEVHTFFYFLLYVFRLLCLSLTAVRISRSVYFFTSNVLLIQVYLRSGNSQRLVTVVLPVYKLRRGGVW